MLVLSVVVVEDVVSAVVVVAAAVVEVVAVLVDVAVVVIVEDVGAGDDVIAVEQPSSGVDVIFAVVAVSCVESTAPATRQYIIRLYKNVLRV